jgi:hypothetical protein
MPTDKAALARGRQRTARYVEYARRLSAIEGRLKALEDRAFAADILKAKGAPIGAPFKHRASDDALMDGTMRPVLELIAKAEVVMGVGQDAAKPYGVDMLVIKGANRMREVVATGVNMEAGMTAIKCLDYDQAEALRQHVDSDPTH